MSSLYPSLEDMQVHKIMQAQENVVTQMQSQAMALPAYTQNPYPELNSTNTFAQDKNIGELYPGLADFMGLELSQEIIAVNMPEYLRNNQIAVPPTNSVSYQIFILSFNLIKLFDCVLRLQQAM